MENNYGELDRSERMSTRKQKKLLTKREPMNNITSSLLTTPAAGTSDNVTIEMEEQKKFIAQPSQPASEMVMTQRRRPSGVAPLKTVATNENLWENMSPWKGNERFYGFYCNTDFDHLEVKARGRKNMQRAQAFSSQHFRAISVYHKKESDRLIIKTKNSGAGLFKAKRNKPLLYSGAIALILDALFFVIASESDGENDWAWGVGAVISIVGLIMLKLSGRKLRVDTAQYLTNLVPIHDVKFVEREASTINFASKQYCCKEDAEDPEFRTSRMAIGFSKSNLSAQLVSGTAVKDECIELVLQANDAYNLHQYLNWYIDS